MYSESREILKSLTGLTRRAIDEYQLIKKGDKVCIGVSGGKDSMSLLSILANMRRYHPSKFELEAVTVSLGFDGVDFRGIKQYCDKIEVNFTIIETQIASIIFDERKENNPCSLCANMRRGAVNNAAKALGCNVVALAHHKDDVIETSLMSMFYEGRFHSFTPITWLDRQELNIIRPFIYVEEKEIIKLANIGQFPIIENPCPMDKASQRKFVKDLIHNLEKDNIYLKSNIFGSIKRGLWDQSFDQS